MAYAIYEVWAKPLLAAGDFAHLDKMFFTYALVNGYLLYICVSTSPALFREELNRHPQVLTYRRMGTAEVSDKQLLLSDWSC